MAYLSEFRKKDPPAIFCPKTCSVFYRFCSSAQFFRLNLAWSFSSLSLSSLRCNSSFFLRTTSCIFRLFSLVNLGGWEIVSKRQTSPRNDKTCIPHLMNEGLIESLHIIRNCAFYTWHSSVNLHSDQVFSHWIAVWWKIWHFHQPDLRAYLKNQAQQTQVFLPFVKQLVFYTCYKNFNDLITRCNIIDKFY